jgi:peptide methionine sulfoxide reductase msrA/msrB
MNRDRITSRISSEEKSTLSSYIGLGILVVLAAGAIYLFLLSHEEKKEFTGFDPNRPVPDDTTLKRRLKPEEYSVVRENRDQTAFQNEFWENQRPGIYVDVITGEPLFSSLDKFDSGTGRPTFTKPISPDLIAEIADNSHDMQRVEIRAKRSNAYLGHLFPDQTSPTGRRYAVNSAAFHFIPLEQMQADGYEKFISLVEKK